MSSSAFVFPPAGETEFVVAGETIVGLGKAKDRARELVEGGARSVEIVRADRERVVLEAFRVAKKDGGGVAFR